MKIGDEKMGCTGVCSKRERWNVLIKPTHNCNFNCQYCYDEPFRRKFKGTVMDMRTLNDIIKKIDKYTNKLTLIWHGGEPLIVGKQWYKDAQNILGLYSNLHIEQNIQTNGSLLDAEWAKLSNKYNIKIGISFDGPFQKIRDSKNIEVERSIKNYLSAGGDSGFICVINNENYLHMIDTYNYFKNDLKSGVSFNIIFETEESSKNGLDLETDGYRRKLQEFYKYWVHDEKGVYERTSLNVTSQVFGIGTDICTRGDCRDRWLGFNPVGDIYPCDRFVPEKYSPGNIINYKDIGSVYDSDQYMLYYDENTIRLNECAKCDYFSTCGGGCVANHITAYGHAKKNYKQECDIHKNTFTDTYNAWRDIDIYTENLNGCVKELIVENSVFTLKEIKETLQEIDNNIELKYNGDTEKILNCSEYLVYRLINPLMKSASNEHVNYMTKNVKVSVNIEDKNVLKIIRPARLEYLRNLIIENLDEIRAITK